MKNAFVLLAAVAMLFVAAPAFAGGGWGSSNVSYGSNGTRLVSYGSTGGSFYGTSFRVQRSGFGCTGGVLANWRANRRTPVRDFIANWRMNRAERVANRVASRYTTSFYLVEPTAMYYQPTFREQTITLEQEVMVPKTIMVPEKRQIEQKIIVPDEPKIIITEPLSFNLSTPEATDSDAIEPVMVASAPPPEPVFELVTAVKKKQLRPWRSQSLPLLVQR